MFPDFTCDTTWCLLALLGSVWSGIQNIKAQKWFEGFSWSDLESLSMKPPYVRASYSSEPVPVKQADTRTCGIQVPSVTSKLDTTNFRAVYEEEMPPLIPYTEYEDPKMGWDEDFATSE